MARSQKPIQTLSDFKDSVTKVQMTSTQIIASSVDGFLRVFDMRMMKMLCFGQFESINSFDFGLDLNFAAVATLDSSIHLLDISDGQLVSTYKGGHTSLNYHGTVKFTKDGNKYIATGSECGNVFLYEADTKAVALKIPNGQSQVISIDVASPNRIITGAADGAIKLWEY